ncbi:MRN complex-interacting protein [Gouania willdenowi]|uniref:MRN complex-interacting protein n=1 Tax=Gouania willdenowi TaxID=441366 RepID=UPI001054C4B3|nr:MRN complex-interacting protein [Gouania willdenowi]
MSQVFHCVRCFRCDSFQVQQVKKVNKWSCKMCGIKQSLLKEYGRGSGADCRRQVQKLNAMRGAKLEECNNGVQCEQTEEQVRPAQSSRWNKYLDSPEEAEPEDDLNQSMHLHSNNTSHSGIMKGNSDNRPTLPQSMKPLNYNQSLSFDCQAHGQSLRPTGASTDGDITSRPRPLLPVSMFESGEDFSSDIF